MLAPQAPNWLRSYKFDFFMAKETQIAANRRNAVKHGLCVLAYWTLSRLTRMDLPTQIQPDSRPNEPKSNPDNPPVGHASACQAKD